ncbi:NAD(P)H-hydrate epimerase [Halorubellus sp. JP-L1]|nr:NAD(P)H-hydrate epimerase [Halorubellus sp. JP-L1]
MHPSFATTRGVPVPAVTADEMREVDRVAVEDVGLSLPSMLENAGRNLAKASRAVVGDRPQRAFVAAGGGANGGGGLAAARHLENHGTDVTVALDRAHSELEAAPAAQADALDGTDATLVDATDDVVDAAVDAVLDADVAIDALVGYGLADALEGPAGDLAQVVDQGAKRALSLDVPSGFDATTGEAPGRAVHPNATLALALPKTGLDSVPGDLLLGDVGIPVGVYERAGVPAPDPSVFGSQYVVALTAVED